MLYESSEVRLISRPFISARANGVAVADSPPPTAAQCSVRAMAPLSALAPCPSQRHRWRVFDG